MSITKTTLLITAAMGIATTACAQDANTSYDSNTEVLDTTTVDSFATSDLDANGGLDRTEFESFVRAKADEGEAGYVALAEAGEMDVEFMTLDTNADGLLDAGELGDNVEVEVDVDVETDSMDESGL